MKERRQRDPDFFTAKTRIILTVTFGSVVACEELTYLVIVTTSSFTQSICKRKAQVEPVFVAVRDVNSPLNDTSNYCRYIVGTGTGIRQRLFWSRCTGGCRRRSFDPLRRLNVFFFTFLSPIG